MTPERERAVRAVYDRGEFYDREVIADLLAALDAERAAHEETRRERYAAVVAQNANAYTAIAIEHRLRAIEAKCDAIIDEKKERVR